MRRPPRLRVLAAPRIEAEALHRRLGHVLGIAPPFAIFRLCEHLGIAVDAFRFRTDISGVLIRSDTEFFIAINRRQARTRQRFSAAHELYHYLAHRDLVRPLQVSMAWPPPGLWRLESEANCFAAELLMPEAAVLRAWRIGLRGPGLRRAFDVSAGAMNLRLREMGLEDVRPMQPAVGCGK